MKINEADVAELVDARDLKFVPATDQIGDSCKTPQQQTREIEAKPSDLQNTIPGPQRIQRKRIKGWKMPENTVYVGRPTMWGNYQADGSHPAYAVSCFRRWVNESASEEWKHHAATELRGKNLACWCASDQTCHADVLLELANR